MKNPIGWIEIPVVEMDRAVSFYNAVFDWELKAIEFGGEKMAWFPSDHNAPGASGSLVYHKDFYAPSDFKGPVVYFTCDGVQSMIEKIRLLGGKILKDSKLISEDVGYMGLFLDSEGNRIALHSRNK